MNLKKKIPVKLNFNEFTAFFEFCIHWAEKDHSDADVTKVQPLICMLAVLASFCERSNRYTMWRWSGKKSITLNVQEAAAISFFYGKTTFENNHTHVVMQYITSEIGKKL